MDRKKILKMDPDSYTPMDAHDETDWPQVENLVMSVKMKDGTLRTVRTSMSAEDHSVLVTMAQAALLDETIEAMRD